MLISGDPRKNDATIDRVCGSIREFGFKIPLLARSDGEVLDDQLRLRAAGKPAHTETTSSSGTRADWSEAFALVLSLEVAYVVASAGRSQ